MSKKMLYQRTRFRNLLFVGFLLIGILAYLYQVYYVKNPSSSDLEKTMIEYRGIYHPFSIKYPKSWWVSELQGTNHGDTQLFAYIRNTEKYKLLVYLSKTENPTDQLREVIEWGLTRPAGKGCKDFNFVDPLHSTMKEILKSSRVEYTCKSHEGILITKENIINCIDHYIIENSYGYVITYCGDKARLNEMMPVLESIVQSFKGY